MPPFPTTTITSIPKAVVDVAGIYVIQKSAFVLPAIRSIFGIIFKPIIILFIFLKILYFRTKLKNKIRAEEGRVDTPYPFLCFFL